MYYVTMTSFASTSSNRVLDVLDRSAMIVLDLQHDFLAPDGRLPVDQLQVPGLLDTLNDLFALFAASKRPVATVGNEFPKFAPTNLFRGRAAIAGSDGSRWDDRAKLDVPYFAKTQRNAFSNPAFVEWVAASGASHLVITGVFAENCVTSTALAAARLGYEVSVFEDAVAGKSSQSRDRSLRRLRKHNINTEAFESTALRQQ